MSDVDLSIAAWDQTMRSLIGLGEGFSEPDWAQRTECPEWTVKDIYSHMVGGELWMAAGHPVPETGLAHIADEPVAQRRDVPAADVLAELREVFALRQRQLVESPPDPDAPTMTAYLQPVTVGILLRMRAFDAWVHEQDVRRAIGVPGALDTPSAGITRDVLLATLPRVVVKRGLAPAGSSVRFAVHGEVAFDLAVAVDDNGRGRLSAPDGEATTTLRLGWEDFSRLGAGRIDRSAAAVEVSGDHELAERILTQLAVTP